MMAALLGIACILGFIAAMIGIAFIIVRWTSS